MESMGNRKGLTSPLHAAPHHPLRSIFDNSISFPVHHTREEPYDSPIFLLCLSFVKGFYCTGYGISDTHRGFEVRLVPFPIMPRGAVPTYYRQLFSMLSMIISAAILAPIPGATTHLSRAPDVLNAFSSSRLAKGS